MQLTLPSRPSARPILASALLAGFLVACGDEVIAPGEDAPAALALVTPPPETVVAGEPISPAPVVELRTAAGEPVAKAGELVVASVSTGTVGGTTSVATDAQGRATFTDLVIVSGEGVAELRFTCCDLASAAHTVSLSFPTDVTVISQASAPSGFGRAGTEMVPGPSVMVTDGNWQPVEGAVVRFTLMGPGTIPVATVATNAEGIAELPSYRFGETAGKAILTARLEGTSALTRFELASTVSGEVTVVDDGFTYAGPVGEDFVLPPIQVTEAGVPQAGVDVRFTWTDPIGVPHTEHFVTGATGRTEAVALPIRPTPGENSFEVFVLGYTPGALRLTVLGEQQLPLRFVANPPANVLDQENSSGRSFVSVRVVNAAGMAVSGVRIVFPIDEANGNVEWWDMFGPEPMGPFYTDENGNASLSWMVPTDPGTYRIAISSPAVEETVTFTAVRE